MTSGDLTRSAQSFDTWTVWGPGLKLDSASSMWVTPVPTGIIPGDIAVTDTLGGQVISPLATAFVRHESNENPSYIWLKVADITGAWRYEERFCAPPELTHLDVIRCSTPSVVVTYSRQDGQNNGLLYVHVVWSQLTRWTDMDSQWDVYYYRKYFRVTGAGICWSPSPPSEIVRVGTVPTQYDEIQPDVAVQANSGLFVLVYNYTEVLAQGGWDWGIIQYMYGFPWENMTNWYGPWRLSDVDPQTQSDLPKAAPKVDTGAMNVDLTPGSPLVPSAVAVWTECRPAETLAQTVWMVWYNRWVPVTPGDQLDNDQNITGDYAGRPKALPQVDIVPDSTGAASHAVHQAIVSWMTCSVFNEQYAFPFAVATVSPWFSPLEMFGDPYALVPNIASYQIADPNQTRQWFGMSYYLSDQDCNAGEVQVRNYSYRVEWNTGATTFNSEGLAEGPYQDGFWSVETPFTGSTLCLRIPMNPQFEQSVFGLGWFDPELTANLSFGEIN